MQDPKSNIIHELILFMHINKFEADFISVLSFQVIHQIQKVGVCPKGPEFDLML